MVDLVSTQCPLCLSKGDDREAYKASFQPEQVTPEIFSARRPPDRICYRMVVCRCCGLMRADPALSEKALAGLYAASNSSEVGLEQDAATTYIQYLRRYLSGIPLDSRILEVGCGQGHFLRALLQERFGYIHGVEPSSEAVTRASEIRELVHHGTFGPGIYPAGHFDLICGFHVFDHLRDPLQFLKDSREYLKSHGRLFLIMHDILAWPARVMGRRCPMIDIEHPFLYNKATLKRLLEANGFTVQAQFCVHNRYPLRYWMQLLPWPRSIKRYLLAALERSGIGRMPLTLAAGNMGIIARKNDE